MDNRKKYLAAILFKKKSEKTLLILLAFFSYWHASFHAIGSLLFLSLFFV